MVGSFNPKSVWEPFGAFSMGVIRGDGRIVYLKGQVALDKEGRVVGKGDMRAQTRRVLENIARDKGDAFIFGGHKGGGRRGEPRLHQ